MRFLVEGVNRSTGEKVNIPVEAPDERAAGWAVVGRGIEVTTIMPAVPVPVSVPRVVSAPAPPNPTLQKAGRILFFVSLILLLVTGGYLVPAHMDYARISDRAELLHRMSRMSDQDIAKRYPMSGYAGMYAEQRELADEPRHEQEMRFALYRLWAVAGAGIVGLLVALGMRPFAKGASPGPSNGEAAGAGAPGAA